MELVVSATYAASEEATNVASSLKRVKFHPGQKLDVALSDQFWKHPLTPEHYHNSVSKSRLPEGEGIILGEVADPHFGMIVDLGVGTGRELGWIKDLPNIEKVVGVDYAPDMLRKCIRVWRNYPKKLILLDEDFTEPDIMKDALCEEKRRAYFVGLDNTFGHLKKEERGHAINSVSGLMRKHDRLALHLLKHNENPRVPGAAEAYLPVVEAIAKRRASVEYDLESRALGIFVGGKRLVSFHGWAFDDIVNLEKGAGLKRVELAEMENSFVVVWEK